MLISLPALCNPIRYLHHGFQQHACITSKRPAIRFGSVLRSIMHLNFCFLFHYSQGKHTSFVGILAWRPPLFPHTVACGMCSVPPHIPYPFRFAPGALLRKRCFATLARCLHVPPALPIYFFSKFSFPCGSIRSLKSAFIIGGLSLFGEQVSPCNTKTRFAAFCITGLT